MALYNHDDFVNYKSLDEIMTEVQLKKELISEIPQEDYSKYNRYIGFSEFLKAYDEVELEIPEARFYRPLLTKIAEHESGFKSNILNKAGAPAYGYFLFMLDGLKWNNITKYSGLSIDEFKNNPKELIKAAIKLAKAFQNGFKGDDMAKARHLGISILGLIGGAWLGGVGGVRKVLNGTGNPSDKHWGGSGDSVSLAIKRYN